MVAWEAGRQVASGGCSGCSAVGPVHSSMSARQANGESADPAKEANTSYLVGQLGVIVRDSI